MDDLGTKIKHYIETQIVASRDVKIGDDDDLLLSNTLDSLGVMRLVEFIENLLDIKIPPEDITIDNFQSVATIKTYIAESIGRPSTSG